MNTQVQVAIVGAGQAGLSVSYLLKQRGIAHCLLERYRSAHTWSDERWDNFCLVTPNWQCRLPGHDYDGADPQGFMLKHEIVAYLERYVQRFQPPVREGVEVRAVRQQLGGQGFGSVGTALIDCAVRSAHALGCHTFLATVQAQNARYFERHHFQPLRELLICNRAHWLMQADLRYFPADPTACAFARAA